MRAARRRQSCERGPRPARWSHRADRPGKRGIWSQVDVGQAGEHRHCSRPPPRGRRCALDCEGGHVLEEVDAGRQGGDAVAIQAEARHVSPVPCASPSKKPTRAPGMSLGSTRTTTLLAPAAPPSSVGEYTAPARSPRAGPGDSGAGGVTRLVPPQPAQHERCDEHGREECSPTFTALHEVAPLRHVRSGRGAQQDGPFAAGRPSKPGRSGAYAPKAPWVRSSRQALGSPPCRESGLVDASVTVYSGQGRCRLPVQRARMKGRRA